MKTIICVRGRGETGKSTALRGFYERLVPEEERVDMESRADFAEEIEYEGVKIGIVTYGDPGCDSVEKVQGFIDDGCEIVVCASRITGKTFNGVYRVARERGCRFVEVTTYKSTVDADHEMLNRCFVESMFNVLHGYLKERGEFFREENG